MSGSNPPKGGSTHEEAQGPLQHQVRRAHPESQSNPRTSGVVSPAATEERIAALLRASDWAGASTVALREYGPQVLTYLRSILRDDDLAGDIFSRFCEKLWRSVRDFRGECAFVTWAYRLAWFAAKEHRRAERRRREERLASDAVSKIVQEVRDGTPGIGSEAEGRWAQIKNSLDPFERSLLLLRVERGLAWKEVARVMSEDGGAPAEAVLRKRFERLRLKLHKLAREQGIPGR
jgi:RNA polymerase sigma-70 factor, ECF subfamily